MDPTSCHIQSSVKDYHPSFLNSAEEDNYYYCVHPNEPYYHSDSSPIYETDGADQHSPVESTSRPNFTFVSPVDEPIFNQNEYPEPRSAMYFLHSFSL